MIPADTKSGGEAVAEMASGILSADRVETGTRVGRAVDAAVESVVPIGEEVVVGATSGVTKPSQVDLKTA